MRLKTTGVRLDEVLAEHDPRHLDRVARPLGPGHRAHERLVRVADVRVDHVEVPLVDRHVDRLADRAAGVVQPRRRVGELHEVAEVLDRPVPAAAVEVADERRAVGRREDRPVPAEDDVVRAVPGDLRELRRRRRLDERAAQAAREPHPLAVDGRARRREELERVGRVVELDPDLLEDPCRRSPRGARAPPRRAPRPACSVRVRNGTCSTCACSRAAWRAGAPSAPPATGLGHDALLSAARVRRAAAAAGTRWLARRGERRRCAARRAYGSVSCGIAIACTKCSWKRGSTAVSTFSTRPHDAPRSPSRAPRSSERDARAGAGGVARPR